MCIFRAFSWWRHQMETSSALLAICAGNSPVPGEFPAQRPVTRSFDVFFDLRPNKWLSTQSWGWWFETPSRPLWRHRNVISWIHTETNEIAWWYKYQTPLYDERLLTFGQVIWTAVVDIVTLNVGVALRCWGRLCMKILRHQRFYIHV